MTRTVEQAKLVLAKAKANPDIKIQVGVQGMSDDSYITANKYVQDGALGHVVMAQIDYSRNGKEDLWEYEYDPDAAGREPRLENVARRCAETRVRTRPLPSLAQVLGLQRRNLGRPVRSPRHANHQVARADLPGIRHGRGRSIRVQDPGEVPDTMDVLLDYPEGLTVQLVSSMANDRKIDHLLRGHKATLEFNSTGFTIVPQKLFQGEQEVVHTKSGAEDILLHHRNLHNAIRKNEALNCPVELGYYGVVASEMGVLSPAAART